MEGKYEINNAVVMLEFLATILHLKGIINVREMVMIGECKTIEDLDNVISEMGD